MAGKGKPKGYKKTLKPVQNGAEKAAEKAAFASYTPDESYLKDATAQFESVMSKVDTDYVGYVSRVADFNASNGQMENQAGAMAKFYNFQLLMMCAQPLSEGIDSSTLSAAFGRFGAMYVASKSFRDAVKDYKKGLNDVSDQKKLDKLDAFAEKHKGGLSEKKQKEYDEIVKRMNGGFMPLSPKTYGLTKLGFAKKAYEDMRKPGADVEAISAKYESAVSALRDKALQEGLDKGLCERNFRMVYGLESAKNPALKALFRETCYDDAEMKSRLETKITMTKDGPVTKTFEVWDGGFVDRNGNEVTEFTIRPPESVDKHIDMMDDRMRKMAETASPEAFASELYHLSVDRADVFAQALKDDCPNTKASQFGADKLTKMREEVVLKMAEGANYYERFMQQLGSFVDEDPDKSLAEQLKEQSKKAAKEKPKYPFEVKFPWESDGYESDTDEMSL